MHGAKKQSKDSFSFRQFPCLTAFGKGLPFVILLHISFKFHRLGFLLFYGVKSFSFV
jgi:hypothetical protein